MSPDPMEQPSDDEEDSACIGPEPTPEITSQVQADVPPNRWEDE